MLLSHSEVLILMLNINLAMTRSFLVILALPATSLTCAEIIFALHATVAVDQFLIHLELPFMGISNASF